MSRKISRKDCPFMIEVGDKVLCSKHEVNGVTCEKLKSSNNCPVEKIGVSKEDLLEYKKQRYGERVVK